MAAERLATAHERAWLYGSLGPSLCNERVRRAGPKQLRKVLCLMSVIEHATVRAAEG
jgi:hypothetical protein